VGEWLSPSATAAGLDQTVTTGIISASTAAGITDPSGYQDFLQTDRPQPGNSGAVLNLRGGRGDNAAIDPARRLEVSVCDPQQHGPAHFRELIARGRWTGWLGVSVQDLSYDLSKTMAVEGPVARLVSGHEGQPAERQGLKQGDIVVAYNRQGDPASLAAAHEAAHLHRQKVKVTILREGKNPKSPFGSSP